MTTALSVRPGLTIIEIDGHQVRAAGGGMVCLRDVLDVIGILRTDDWIKKLNAVSIRIEYHSIGQPKPAAFIDEEGVLEILAGSRKAEAKRKLRDIISALRRRHEADQQQELGLLVRALVRQELKALMPPRKSADARVNEIVRSFSHMNAIPFNCVWLDLYHEFYYRFHHNLTLIGRKEKKTGVQVAVERGWINDLLSLATEMFAGVYDAG